MPTVVRKDGFSIRIYAPPREHPPPHVHVYKAGGHMIIQLGLSGESPRELDSSGMSRREMYSALNLVIEHEQLLATVWEDLHGKGSLG